MDRTLIDHDSAVRQAARQFLDRFSDQVEEDLESFLERWEDISERYWRKYEAGKIGYDEQRRERMRELLDVTPAERTDEEINEILETYLEPYRRHCRLYEDAEQTLQQLTGHNLGVITNGGRDLQYHKLDKTGIRDLFDVIVCSDEADRPKPHPPIFREAIRRAEAEPEHCIYIGDSTERDVRPAKAFGMRAVWINRMDESTPAPFPGDAEVNTLENLPELVSRIRGQTRSDRE